MPFLIVAFALIMLIILVIPLWAEASLLIERSYLRFTLCPKLLFGAFRPKITRWIVLQKDGKLFLYPKGKQIKKKPKQKKKRKGSIRSVISSANFKRISAYLRLGIADDPCASVLLAGTLGTILSSLEAASGADELECKVEPDFSKNVFRLKMDVSLKLTAGKIVKEAILSRRNK